MNLTFSRRSALVSPVQSASIETGCALYGQVKANRMDWGTERDFSVLIAVICCPGIVVPSRSCRMKSRIVVTI
jgi:hypothetical protein